MRRKLKISDTPIKTTKRINIQQLIPIIFAFLIITILLPNGILIPGRDSGAFLYIGQRILEGDIPYRDLWDHKPPLIFIINAIGLFIGGGSMWGVWFLEFVAIYLAVLFGFLLIKKAFGIIPALIGSIAWLIGLIGVLEGGNLTEEYALFCQFASLYLFFLSERQATYSWRGFLIGVMSAISFFLKQNLIGIWVSIVIYLLFNRILTRRWRSLGMDLGVTLLGAISVVLIVIGYFVAHNSLNFFWDAAFRYNFAYSSTTVCTMIKAFLMGIQNYLWFSLVISAWGAALFYLFCNKKQVKNNKALLVVSIIGLPVEFFLTSITGRSYGHYFMAWFPLTAILLSFLVFAFVTLLSQNASQNLNLNACSLFSPKTFIVFWFILLLLTYFLLNSALHIHTAGLFTTTSIKNPISILLNRYKFLKEKSLHKQVADYVVNITNQNDYLLVWGAEGVVNFLTHRRSPTRFFYQYPLVTKGYQTAQMVEEFLGEISVNKPKLIIDTKNELLPPIDFTERQKWINQKSYQLDQKTYQLPPQNLDRFFEFVSSNYTLDRHIENWTIYIYKSSL